ncbi:hypothetical protein [uncultured Chitinophaga sp.]|uniref:hypothetical protein n=1 Tax=uncultured Chitinophaga sp. TaxID=339340 RepID=UPI0025F9FB62|nr:hypothetical protein [uncultured Chitinophaga sp.]
MFIAQSFKWFVKEFGQEYIVARKVLCPVPADFPIKFSQTEQDAYEVLPIVAKQMDVDPSLIELRFYDQSLMTFSNGSKIFSQMAGDGYSAGQYIAVNGKFFISIEDSQLKNAETLIATMAHEIAHIKLLGEKRIRENDEMLTDMVPVIYGLGIFNANAAFNFYQQPDSWGYNKQGYLSQQEWGHALAHLALLRSEGKSPEWIKYLASNIKSDFKKSYEFLSDAQAGELRVVR